MKLAAPFLALAALGALAACEGRADENLAAAAGNEIEGLGDDLGNVAADAIDTAGEIGQAAENGAESVAADLNDGNGLDDGNDAAEDSETNSQ